MVNIEYFNGKEWIPAGGPFGNETIAWISLGGDDLDYRTINAETGGVLTDKTMIRCERCESLCAKKGDRPICPNGCPHPDGKFHYLCGSDYCRCTQ